MPERLRYVTGGMMLELGKALTIEVPTRAGVQPAESRPLPKILSFSAHAPPEEGKEPEEQLSDVRVPDGTDVVFSWEVANADVVILKAGDREVFRFNEPRREINVRPPQGATTEYSITARSRAADVAQSIFVKSGGGARLNVSPELALWEGEPLEWETPMLTVEAAPSLKLTAPLDIFDIDESHSQKELLDALVEALRAAYGQIEDFRTLDRSNWDIEYEGSNWEMTPEGAAGKAAFELKYDWTWKVSKGRFDAEAQMQAVVFAYEKKFKLASRKGGSEIHFLEAVGELSKTIPVSPELTLRSGKVQFKGVGVKAAFTVTVKPAWKAILKSLGQRIAAAAATEGGIATMGLGAAAVGGTVLTWLAFAYEVNYIQGLGSIREQAMDLGREYWDAYWAAVRQPDEYYNLTSDAVRAAHELGQRRGRLFRSELRKEFPGITDADFKAACDDALPDIFRDNETALRNDMIRNVFFPEAQVYVWKKYIHEYGHPTFESAEKRRWQGWGALFGEFPQKKGDPLAKVYHYEDDPAGPNSWNVPWD